MPEKEKFCKLLDEAIKDEEKAPKMYRELADLAHETFSDNVDLQYLAYLIGNVIAEQEGTHETLLKGIKVLGCSIKKQ